MLPFRVISQRSKNAMHCKSFISICFRDLSLASYLLVMRPWHTALRPSFIINTLQEYRHSKGLCFLINIHMLVCIVFPPQLFLFLSLYHTSPSYFLCDCLYFWIWLESSLFHDVELWKISQEGFSLSWLAMRV